MSHAKPSNIAIVGMSCLFPGAGSVHRFWENVCGRVDAVSDPPEDWPFHYGYDPNSTSNDRLYCKRGGYLNELAEFDPVKYGVMPTSVDGADPEQFLALRVAHETLADGGYLNDKPFNRKATAVILGRGAFPNRGLVTALQHGMVVDQTLDILKRLHPEYAEDLLAEIKQELKKGIPQFNADTTPGLISNVMTGRIANRLDLQGPNYGVDAACAASLLAVDHGIRELESGRCDMVLAGGVSVFSSAALNLAFCQLSAASRQGMIRPFDERADGTLLGSGLGMVLLKRVEDAERDGDRIYAVVRGIGIASDGRATGILAPRIEGEELAIRRAYEATGYDPSTIDLVEAHGTGTPVGDAAEIQSLTRVFGLRQGNRPTIALGSVKSMISHLIPAAGIAGMIKTSLSLYHKVLPPTIHCERPNPELHLERTPFYLNTQTRPWIHAADHPRRAGMNSFGFGGINTHTILEEYVGPQADESHTLMREWDSEVFLLQGTSREEVVTRAGEVLAYLQRTPKPVLRDLAFTLNCPFEAERRTLAVVAGSAEDLTRKLEYAIEQLGRDGVHRLQDRNGVYYFEDRDPQQKLAFLFPGEGCQYPNLLADLCLHFPEVRKAFDLSDGIWRQAFSDFLTSEVLFPIPSPDPADPPEVDERIWDLDVATSAVYTANYAMFRLLRSLKIQPDFMAGHSSGELTALHASGALLDQDDQQIMSLCLELLGTGRSMLDRVPDATLMTVGVTDRDIVEEFLQQAGDTVEVVIDNCPHQVILCGSKEAITSARATLQGEGAICTMLPFERAYHTAKYQPVSDAFFELFQEREFASPNVPVYSCATAEPYPADPMQVRRWAADQWAQPVRFQETVKALYEAGTRLFVEVGPRATLTGFVEDILEDEPFLAIPSNVHFRSGITQLNHLVGLLAAQGVPMELDSLYQRREPQRVELAEPADAAPAKRRLKPMVLNLELPQLTLDDPQKYRDRLATAQRPVTAPPAAAATPPAAQPPRPAERAAATPLAALAGGNDVTPMTADLPPGGDRNGHHSSSAASHGAPTSPAVPATMAAVSAQSKDQVMQSYLASMDQFLQMQQQVYSAFLQRQAGAAAAHTVDKN